MIFFLTSVRHCRWWVSNPSDAIGIISLILYFLIMQTFYVRPQYIDCFLVWSYQAQNDGFWKSWQPQSEGLKILHVSLRQNGMRWWDIFSICKVCRCNLLLITTSHQEREMFSTLCNQELRTDVNIWWNYIPISRDPPDLCTSWISDAVIYEWGAWYDNESFFLCHTSKKVFNLKSLIKESAHIFTIPAQPQYHHNTNPTNSAHRHNCSFQECHMTVI